MQLPLHKKMSNQEISEVMGFIAGVLKLQNSNPFRSRAYDNAATTISQLTQPMHEMFLSNPDFDNIPGIGDTLNQKLTELFTTGTIKAFQKYVADIPAGTFELWKVHGIGIKRGHQLAVAFKLDDAQTALKETLAAAEAGQIRSLPGFGEKSEKDIIEAITQHSFSQKGRIPYHQASDIANQLIGELKKCPAISKIEALGSLRRQAATIGDIDLGLVVSDLGQLKACLEHLTLVKRVGVAGEQLFRVFLTTGQQVDIKIATETEWGAFLQHFTGSKEHNIRLREFALRQDKSLSEHGIKIIAGPEKGQLKQFAREEDFYAYLGLNWIPPQSRVGADEIEKAKM